MIKKDELKILMLEGIHQNSIDYFEKQGYTNIEYYKKALEKQELIEKIKEVHFIGIRSRTQLDSEVLATAKKLMGIGAFCIGTNQIDLDFAKLRGVPVFNAPFSNTRSVAELVIAEIIMLMRRIPEKNMAAHCGDWQKTAENAFEVRGKKLGIVGYGHIGLQISTLAEFMGMEVYYYDIMNKLNIGNARACKSLEELLPQVDVVTLHVPATSETEYMIGENELVAMKKGSYLINASRGNVVEIDKLSNKLKSGHILGAAIDVFPSEPGSLNDEFVSELRGYDNVLLTPHIGGSTQEAQANIAIEVADKLDKYFTLGRTIGGVNFPNIALGSKNDNRSRYYHIHKNVPGVLNAVNKIFSDHNRNIAEQYLQTDGDIGYVITDIDHNGDDYDIFDGLKKVEGTIKARMAL